MPFWSFAAFSVPVTFRTVNATPARTAMTETIAFGPTPTVIPI